VPNQRDPFKKSLRVWIPADLYEKYKRRAKELEMPMSEVLLAHIIHQTKNIHLTTEDYEALYAEARKKSRPNKD